ncbi:DUF2202 domain-containing protein [Candidatus Gracilibacteria bacterium]|nr:DUF2202 domain-containing protein [Candidatus Gracilibacteria bacterium]OIO78308.1 MAG: hypothetical protein AUJ87_00040 [Candidatus Gracilibacteria bacterium CG1_02_38_174]PIQ11669.1 MAG: hypothetical protein COW68_02290 [Candidatus Gracilibacteria bacterium CG18_big_fil_WC_8_21_14_2_50_38_16]PIQ41436.1 MAG: hypothetical protein COW06_02840 [Candidatus Gracilibacteria bacterium CG12_big_fil_rev_8_21_14_0_65_38_15]PIZ01479.1 MAG: hypothetical protein COY60_03400 [Candidatus Gracilibacteria b
MKTNTLLISGIVVGGLLITTVLVTFATGYNGFGYIMNGKNTQAIHSNSSLDQSHSELLVSIPTSPLSDAEKLALSYGYSEEMVARDAYNYFYSLYGIETFQKIAASEQQHMDAVKTLLDRYSLPIPTGYGTLESTFNALKAEGEKGAKEALEVGLKIEMLDIDDIANTIKNTDNDDLKAVFLNIGGASYNHLRGFSQALSNNGYTQTVDISKYLSSAEISSRGPLQYKFADKLTKEGVKLPEISTSMNANQGAGHKGNGGQG